MEHRSSTMILALRLVAVVVIPFGAPDYLAHAINYAVLSVLLIWALSEGEWRAMTGPVMAFAVVLAVLLGIGDESRRDPRPDRRKTYRPRR